MRKPLPFLYGKQIKGLLTCMCLLLLFSMNALAQNKVITGTVVSLEDNESLPGVIITTSMGKKSTSTDSNGKFSIEVAPTENLIVRMIGFLEQNVVIGQQTKLTVKMKIAEQSLAEVVVVGYGTQKKANLTGAISSVSGEEFKGRATPTVGSMLQGQMPGVTVVSATAEPGSNGGTINIRGIGTLNDSSPLVVIDGVPSGNLNILNPDDIESVTVLKDAASSSIYGVRGANGVILVTTKKGKNNAAPKLSYQNYFGIQTPTALPGFLNSVNYMTLLNEAKVNAGANPTYTDEQIEIARNGSDLDYYASTNWIEEIYKSHAPQQNHNLNLTGGGNNMNYYVSYGFLKEGGLITGDSYNANRHNARLRVSSTLFERLNIDANLGYIDRGVSGSSAGIGAGSGPIYTAHVVSPLVPVRFGNGNWGYLGGSVNPIAIATDGGTNDFTSQEITANLQATLNITSDFRVKGQYGLVKSNSFRDIFSKTIDFISPATNTVIYQSNFPNKIDNRDYRSIYQTFIGTAEYEKTFAEKHYVKALAGVSSEETTANYFQASRTNLPTQDVGNINLGTLNQLNDASASSNALQSVFGRLNYVFNQKYLLEGNFRYDGSSRFAPNLRWNTFYSGSAGWIFSEEKFFAPLKSIIEFGKIRLSYGTQGNDKVGSDYAFLAAISSVNTMPIGNDVTIGYRQTGVPNRLLTWESVVKQDIGIDLTLLQSRLSVTADYYINTTNDILLNVPLPDVLGTAFPPQNAGKVENKGWELMVSWKDQVNDFSYGASLNLSDVKNKVLSLGDMPPVIGDRIRQVGYSIDSFYGFEAKGISQISDYTLDPQTNKYVPNFPYDSSYPMQPGDIMYNDLNGDGKITTADDRKVIGSAIPRYTYGFRGDLGYKNFDFSFFLQGVGQADGYIAGSARHAFISDGSNPQAIHLDRWTTENTNASYPRLSYGYNYNQRLSTYWLENAAYLRLKNVQLGYTLPKIITEKLRIDKLRVFASADNLLTSSDFFYGYDPETPVSTGGYYPQVKTFIFGLNINFK